MNFKHTFISSVLSSLSPLTEGWSLLETDVLSVDFLPFNDGGADDITPCPVGVVNKEGRVYNNKID